MITAVGLHGLLADSCHNQYSMTACDNYIGQLVSAVENGPDWTRASSSSLSMTAAAELAFCTEHDISWSFWSYNSLVRYPSLVPYLQAGFGSSQ